MFGRGNVVQSLNLTLEMMALLAASSMADAEDDDDIDSERSPAAK